MHLTHAGVWGGMSWGTCQCTGRWWN